jgi:integrase
VPESKLLTDNPWRNFTWIEGFDKPVRQFDHGELVSLLDYLEAHWTGITVATAFAKVMFWSWARRIEVSSLRWADEHCVASECHFETTGKWNVKKWFRLPAGLRNDLEQLKTDSEFVFGGYPEQLLKFHSRKGAASKLNRLRSDFAPENLGDWMYHRVKEWSAMLPNGSAYLHVFRKTSLQHALTGEHIEQTVAEEASITPSVMRTSYARASDQEFRRMSNKTFERLRRSLPTEVAVRYGCIDRPSDRLTEQLDLARARGDWEAVARIAAELTRLDRNAG